MLLVSTTFFHIDYRIRLLATPYSCTKYSTTVNQRLARVRAVEEKAHNNEVVRSRNETALGKLVLLTHALRFLRDCHTHIAARIVVLHTHHIPSLFQR